MSGTLRTMGRWTEQADWVGPTDNQSGPMDEQRGMVLHVMQGSLSGSVAWAKNPASQVSFHFGTSKAGACQQLIDTDVTAWTQGDGNGSWVSVENEDFSGNPLNAAQVENLAQLYARGVREYGWPYQLADSPSGRGLGWHGMGGVAWGNHPDCPGQPIIDQRGLILARAEQINEGDDMSQEAEIYAQNASAITFAMANGADAAECRYAWTGDGHTIGDPFTQTLLPFWARVNSGGGGTGGGATPAQVSAAVRAELDKTKLAGA